MRNLLRCAVAVALLLVLASGVARAATPEGARLAVVRTSWNTHRTTLLTVNPNGGAPVRLAGGQENDGLLFGFFGPLSWRPDGTEVAFSDFGEFFLAKVRGGARAINAAAAEWPVFAPDGHTLAFTRGGSIWTIDLTTREQHQLTPRRRGLALTASSFSPDGTTLLATRSVGRRRKAEPVALDLETGRVTRLLADGLQPIYSPDGSQIALFRKIGKRETNDLFVLNAESGGLRRLTRTQPGYELFASWDPSGERIAFARFRGRNFEWANAIVQINADGTCETEILSQRRTIFYGPAWQPGAGREAGRIEC